MQEKSWYSEKWVGRQTAFSPSRYVKFKISAETANRADSGQFQLWSEPSVILNVRSSSTPEPVAFTIP